MRRAVVIFVAAAACGRIGFDRSPSGDAGPSDDATLPGDGGPPPPLMCGETLTGTAGALSGTAGSGNTASMTGEVGAGQPLITATSTGFAVAYRSALGLRVFDRAGTRTLDPAPALFDLVTWADRAILVWTKLGDARPRLTRLCP